MSNWAIDRTHQVQQRARRVLCRSGQCAHGFGVNGAQTCSEQHPVGSARLDRCHPNRPACARAAARGLQRRAGAAKGHALHKSGVCAGQPALAAHHHRQRRRIRAGPDVQLAPQQVHRHQRCVGARVARTGRQAARAKADEQNIATKAHGTNGEDMLARETLAQDEGILRTNSDNQGAPQGEPFP